jgi:hypothetical protein
MAVRRTRDYPRMVDLNKQAGIALRELTRLLESRTGRQLSYSETIIQALEALNATKALWE